jgi:hypothetical protein
VSVDVVAPQPPVSLYVSEIDPLEVVSVDGEMVALPAATHDEVKFNETGAVSETPDMEIESTA